MGHEIERKSEDEPFATILSRIAAQSGRSPVALLIEIAMLRFGRGRLSMRDYVAMRLFDQDWYGSVDKSGFVGFRKSQKIWMQANFRVDLFGLVNNKLAADILFAAHGFPVLQTVALFREGVGMETYFLIKNAVELGAFLRNAANYPMFGKPIGGHQSLGSASLDHYDAAADRLVTTTGKIVGIDEFVAFVQSTAAAGYLFQRRLSPHSEVRAICGDRLATVRLLTVVANGRPKLLRACWKIPGGINGADNFWRDGNLLATLDIETGRVVRVVRRAGADFDEVTHHPDSGVYLNGFTIPNWRQVTELALKASRVVEDLPLVGWDVACVDDGAVLVELNETPDFRLHQIADRRGILSDELSDFLAGRRNDAAIGIKAAVRHNKGQ